MPTALPRGLRRLWPLALVLTALAAAFALPSGARAAEDQSCFGDVKQIKPTADRDTGAQYEFSCRNPITSFAIVSTSQIAGFDVTADVFDSEGQGGELQGTDRFGECEGDLPGYGFRCTGTYSGQGRFVRASFDGVRAPCARDASGHVAMRVSVLVASSAGKIAGPYELGKPKGCPKAKHKKKKAKKG